MTHIFAGITLFCDDLREELSGMNTLVGIYSDNVRVEAVPFAFPKLALYTRLIVPVSFEIEPISIELHTGASSQLLTTITAELINRSIADARRDGANIGGLISRALFAPLPVMEAVRLRVVAKTDSYEFETGTLNIGIGTAPPTSPIASPPPSARSPSGARKKAKKP